MLSLKAHNVLDYASGVFLIATPFIFGFSDIAAAKNLFLGLGLGLLTYSLLTNYHFSIARLIPLGVHMTFDALIGVTLILAPLLFAYRDLITNSQYAVHAALGLAALAQVAAAHSRSEESKTPLEKAEIRHHHHLFSR